MLRSKVQAISTLLFAVTIGGTFFLTFILRVPSSSAVVNNNRKSSELSLPRRSESNVAFHLGVTITFPKREDKELFVDLFKPLARYVEDFELGTLSYQLLQSDSDPLRVHVMERYKDKEYFLNVHRNSSEFKYFRAELQKLYDKGAKADGNSFVETGIGFL
jgi:quinol monooxygenase YgiN